ncbi:MAG: adenosine kinase [Candidatus Kapabacteria bacterium]|nr:adenosine kinase [Candidatus Kapabacteria bacterium]
MNQMNKDIQLCGIGNGLVDFQFEVSFQELENLGYRRGEMRLIDITEVPDILFKVKDKKHNKCSGGSAANSVIAFTEFGGKAAYKTSLGDDDLGHFYSNEFKDMGIELRTAFLQSDPTGVCLVFITPDSERTMITALGATAKFDDKNLDSEIIKRSDWLYLEGYGFTQKPTTNAIYKAVDYALESGTKISVSFSDFFVTENFRDDLKYVVDRSDLVFCNETEALSYTQTTNLEDAFNFLSKTCPNLVITMGARGSKIKWGNQIYQIDPFETNSIDSTGAGDMFAGAFLFGMYKWNDAAKAGQLASLAASKVIAQLGARLKEDYNAILESININH